MRFNLNKLNKLLLVLLMTAGLFLLTKPSLAQEKTLTGYFFYGTGCPHCDQEQRFFDQVLLKEYPNLEIKKYEIYNNRSNVNFLQKVAQELGIRVDGVPLFIVGDQHFVGYTEGVTSREIEERVAECLKLGCFDSIARILETESELPDKEPISPPAQSLDQEESQSHKQTEEKLIKLPVLGEVNALSFSLPVLTIIIGALDGFNPCAMWVLLFLISLLLGMKDRRRMWILGLTFIIASALVYFIFMAAWLNLILFLGMVTWVRALIGVVALAGGVYSLKDFMFSKDSGCEVADGEKRQRVFERLKTAVKRNSLWLALGGIIVLAFAVNLVELICSAGFPAVYTQVLALNEMATWRYYLYLLLYIFFFMLDDLVIFLIAMATLKLTGITTKYTKISRLVGGILMLIIGLLLIFKPAWLMFG
ncbi:MAG: glutaredoxin family protein [Patescibacteria group bacterium]|jgi:hypothetical protein